MHISEEHGAEHAHDHLHTHADGTAHSHPHTHDHSEAHEHVHEGEAHSHTHTHADGTVHTHPHVHEHGEGHEHVHDHDVPADLAKVKAIMKYMVEHNEHHADELADLLGMLPEDAKAKLTRAIGTFEAANVELRGVLESLERQ